MFEYVPQIRYTHNLKFDMHGTFSHLQGVDGSVERGSSSTGFPNRPFTFGDFVDLLG
jgi:hypothetical protein